MENNKILVICDNDEYHDKILQGLDKKTYEINRINLADIDSVSSNSIIYKCIILEFINNFFKNLESIQNSFPVSIIIAIHEYFQTKTKIELINKNCLYLDINDDSVFDYKEILNKIIQNKLQIKLNIKKEGWFEFTLNSRLEFAYEVSEYVFHLSKKTNFSNKTLEQISFSLKEIQNNAIEHAHNFDDTKKIKLSAAILSNCIVIKISDEGKGYDFRKIDDPLENLEKSIEQREFDGKRFGGFGLAMAKRVMDEVIFNETGNTIILTKYFNEDN